MEPQQQPQRQLILKLGVRLIGENYHPFLPPHIQTLTLFCDESIKLVSQNINKTDIIYAGSYHLDLLPSYFQFTDVRGFDNSGSYMSYGTEQLSVRSPAYSTDDLSMNYKLSAAYLRVTSKVGQMVTFQGQEMAHRNVPTGFSRRDVLFNRTRRDFDVCYQFLDAISKTPHPAMSFRTQYMGTATGISRGGSVGTAYLEVERVKEDFFTVSFMLQPEVKNVTT